MGFHKNAKEVDIIISTAAIPGRKSPVLIEDYMVKDMKAGSVIVDLAAAGGGNCALTKPGELYVTDNGVTIIGYNDLPGRMGLQASSMYAQNMLNMSNHITGHFCFGATTLKYAFQARSLFGTWRSL